MGHLTAEIAGELYPTHRISYARNYPFGPTRASIVVVGWESGLAGGDAVEIKRDEVLVWKGKAYDIRPYIEKGVYQEIYAFSLEKKHEDLDVVDREKLDAPEDFIDDGLAGSDLSAGALNAYGADINMRFGSTDDAKWNRISQNNELAFVTGWEIYTSPAGVVDFKLACGVDRGQTPAGTTVEFKYGELLVDWDRRAPHRVYSRDIVDVVKVLGHREGDYMAVGTAGAGADVRKFARKSLIEDDTCGKAAAAILADIVNATQYGCMHVIDTYAGAAYDLYDTVSVVDRRYGINGDYRIYKILKEWTPDAGESTRIWVTNLTKITGNGPFMLDKTKYRMTAGARAIRDMGRGAQSIINPDALDFEGNIDPGTLGGIGWVNYESFQFIGESEDGYTITEAGTGTVTVNKDYCLISAGALATAHAKIESVEDTIDFANPILWKIRFKIDSEDGAGLGRKIFLRWEVNVNKKVYVVIRNRQLSFETSDGGGGTNVTTGSNVSLNTWHEIWVYVNSGVAKLYLDGALDITNSTNVPTTEMVQALNCDLYNAAQAKDYFIIINNWEVKQQWS